MAVTAAMVKELRERTGAGMMECKKALVDAGGDMDAAVEAMRHGAYDYLTKPVDLKRLRLSLQHLLEHQAVRRRIQALEVLQGLLVVGELEVGTPKQSRQGDGYDELAAAFARA